MTTPAAKLRNKRYRDLNREKLNAAELARYRSDPQKRERAKQRARERRKERPLRHRAAKWGLSEDLLSYMLELGCAICGATRDANPHEPFAVDHCHKTGHVRGVLCTGCNQGLGNFGDDPILLGKAIDYLLNAARERMFLGSRAPMVKQKSLMKSRRKRRDYGPAVNATPRRQEPTTPSLFDVKVSR